MKKNIKKSAFSIPELLIFMVIVGIISVSMITLVKPNNKALKYQYYNAYNTLRIAAYNISQDALDATESDASAGYTAFDKRFAQNAKEFCQKLAVNRNAEQNSNDSKYGYINTAIYNCATTPTVPKNGADSNFTKDKMAFQSSNSMKYYLTERATSSIKNDLGSNISVNYYLVWVDLNGDKGPNTTAGKEGRPADIVPFLVTDSGQVVPMGYPITDKLYLQARVEFVTEEKTYLSDPMTFYEAQMTAYGNKQYPSMDLKSVRAAWKTIFSGTAVLPKTFPAEKSQDSQCTPESSQDITQCSIEIDEQTGMF